MHQGSGQDLPDPVLADFVVQHHLAGGPAVVLDAGAVVAEGAQRCACVGSRQAVAGVGAARKKPHTRLHVRLPCCY